MYGGKDNNRTYNYDLAEENNIPYIEDGYYYFIEKYGKNYKDTDNMYSDDKLFDRYSYNFILAMFDKNTNYLYYFEYDT